ncbi:hypothetical protein F2P81_002434 [Scophthalmus maximus]|uniref:Uncharacterized protein n=1 Tax=Scophthalmus maximus TaxID=52904 RepID=A0A6A4TKZ5_SCOMX|nr:hypothetical protein F2P81_002434 [Scophthalmus maximus]
MIGLSLADYLTDPLSAHRDGLYEQTKLKLIRFYICTKEEGPSSEQFPSEINECGEDSFSEDLSVSITEGVDSQLIEEGSNIDANYSIKDLLDNGHSSDISEQTAVPIDSPQTEHEHACHETFEDVPEVDEADTVVWDPEDDLGRADGDETVVITWNYGINEDVTQIHQSNVGNNDVAAYNCAVCVQRLTADKEVLQELRLSSFQIRCAAGIKVCGKHLKGLLFAECGVALPDNHTKQAPSLYAALNSSHGVPQEKRTLVVRSRIKTDDPQSQNLQPGGYRSDRLLLRASFLSSNEGNEPLENKRKLPSAYCGTRMTGCVCAVSSVADQDRLFFYLPATSNKSDQMQADVWSPSIKQRTQRRIHIGYNCTIRPSPSSPLSFADVHVLPPPSNTRMGKAFDAATRTSLVKQSTFSRSASSGNQGCKVFKLNIRHFKGIMNAFPITKSNNPPNSTTHDAFPRVSQNKYLKNSLQLIQP